MLCIQGADVTTDWLLRDEGNSLCKGNGWHLPAGPQSVLEKPFPPELTSHTKAFQAGKYTSVKKIISKVKNFRVLGNHTENVCMCGLSRDLLL